MVTNKDVYPITAKLEEDLSTVMGLPAIRQIVETVGEYEHGTAEAANVFSGVDLLFGEGEDGEEDQTEANAVAAYAAVAEDLAWAISSALEDEVSRDDAIEGLGDQIGRWEELSNEQIGARFRAYAEQITDGQGTTWDGYTVEQLNGLATFLREGLGIKI